MQQAFLLLSAVQEAQLIFPVDINCIKLVMLVWKFVLSLLSFMLQQDLVGFANDSTNPDRLKIMEALLKHGAKAQYWGVSFCSASM